MRGITLCVCIVGLLFVIHVRKWGSSMHVNTVAVCVCVYVYVYVCERERWR